MSSLIEIRNVRHSFRTGFWMKSTEVLKGIHFNVPTGSVYGVLGPNGAGKTSLIHLIAGLRKPTSGSVLIKGVSAMIPDSRVSLGYVPERPYFHGFLTPRRLLRFFGRLSGLNEKEIEIRRENVLEAVGMSHAVDRELSQCSKGMIQRIGIAQALLHDPDILVFDEPMSGLDPIGRREMRELFVELQKRGKTLFFSSHLTSDIEETCSHLAVIQSGKLVGAGPLSQFLKKADRLSVEITGIEEGSLRNLPMKFEVTRKGDRFSVQIKEIELPDFLKKINDLGAQLISVNPLKNSLDDFFLPDVGLETE